MKKLPEISLADLKEQADAILEDMVNLDDALTRIRQRHCDEIARINRAFSEEMSPIVAEIQASEVEIKRLMKSGKDKLFAGGDIVYLQNGNLLYAKGDRVVIPRGALAACEQQGFADVIKTVKSLDRDAIEKWPDEKLFLIGAERKPTETFNYEIKKRKGCEEWE
jgi:phage host-nuclease inhibitor protein Gam